MTPVLATSTTAPAGCAAQCRHLSACKIYIQNRPFPMKIPWGFIGNGRNLRICVWWCGRGRQRSASGVVGAAGWNWRQSYLVRHGRL